MLKLKTIRVIVTLIHVSIEPNIMDGFWLIVSLGVDQATKGKIAVAAHAACSASNTVRGNIDAARCNSRIRLILRSVLYIYKCISYLTNSQATPKVGFKLAGRKNMETLQDEQTDGIHFLCRCTTALQRSSRLRSLSIPAH